VQYDPPAIVLCPVTAAPGQADKGPEPGQIAGVARGRVDTKSVDQLMLARGRRSFWGAVRGGRMPPVRAVGGQAAPAEARVSAGQGLYGSYRDALVVHGKEKVYGSIPYGGSAS
jgi:hypothetical protein